MSTNELAPKKRIADDLIPDHPPVPDPETLAYPDLIPAIEEPPHTRLLLEGFDPDEITVEFLLDLHDLGDVHGLAVESISVGQPELNDP